MSRRWLVLASLYVAQGLPFGFFTQALPVRMRESGMSLGAIGFASLLAAPWALKALWAPLVDRFGTRRAWIIPLQLGSALVLAIASFLPPERALVPVLIAVLITNALAAAQDVATDALAIDVLAPAERGLGNGIQVAGYRVGMIIGGGALLVVLGTIGWAGALRLLALGTVLTTLPILSLNEPPRTRRPRVGLRAITSAALRPGAGAWFLLLVVYKSGDALATAMLRPMLVDRGLGAADVGVLLGQYGFGAGLVGALLGGWLVPRLGVWWPTTPDGFPSATGADRRSARRRNAEHFGGGTGDETRSSRREDEERSLDTRLQGRRLALIAFGAFQALGVGAYAVVASTPSVGLPLIIGFEHLAGGMATAALFTCMMDACRPGLEATDYAVQASIVVLATGLGATVSGLIADAIGYTACFTIAALISLCGVALAGSSAHRRVILIPEETRA